MTETEGCTIYLVEDHAHFRNVLRHLFGTMEGVRVCGDASSAEEALDEIERIRPDYAVVDLSLPRMSGVDLVRELRRRSIGTSCLILSGHAERAYAELALNEGACGDVLKGRPLEIIEALERMVSGDVFISEELA